MTIIDVDVEAVLSIAAMVSESLETIETLVGSDNSDAIESAVRTAMAASNGLNVIVGRWAGAVEEEVDEETAPVADDDPEICQHPDDPPYIQLPGGVKMCQHCGANCSVDGEWSSDG